MMEKRITIWYEPGPHVWVITLENSPIMGDSAWHYNTWAECMMHANVLRRVWNHI